MEVESGKIVDVKGDKYHPANFGRLCTKGKTSFQALNHETRLGKAHFRKVREGPLLDVDMESAIKTTAERLLDLLDRHGPDALSLYVSGQISLEAQYLANKLAKGFIRTNQIESNSRLCMASAGAGYKLSLGADGPPGSYEDFDQADLFFVIGSNMAECHPVLFRRMMDRKKSGARIIVVDPRRTPTAEKADLFLQIKSGTDLALINGILLQLMKNDRVDTGFIEAHTEGWDSMRAFLWNYSLEEVTEVTGLRAENIATAAEWIGSTSRWISCWTMGLNQSTQGTFNTNGICNLHLATGAICRPGSGPFSLTGQPNAMGGREMGYMGLGLPGQRSADSEEDRIFVEKAWGLNPRTLKGSFLGGAVAMFDSMASGEIKGCWIIGSNPIASMPNRSQVIKALQTAELVIVQDAFLETETASFADILFPGALWAEAEGVMVNSERNMTLMQKAVEPYGEALPDWMIVSRIAAEMGFGKAFHYGSAEEVFEEIKGFYNPLTGYDLRGASYARLKVGPLQWPCPPNDQATRHPIRYIADDSSQKLGVEEEGLAYPSLVFPTASGKARFLPRPHQGPAEPVSPEYPFVLNTGRLPHHWHTMTKTGKIPLLNKLNPSPFVAINPEDADRLGIVDGDWVKIISRRAQLTLPAKRSDRVMLGNCWAPLHWNDCYPPWRSINAVTHNKTDPISREPEFKASAVQIVLQKACQG